MKKLKLFIFLFILILIIIFLLKINFSQFIKIYYIQVILIIILFLIFIRVLKLKFFLSFFLIFVVSISYFYIYPNYFQKNLIDFSEIFLYQDEKEIKKIDLKLTIGSGYLKIESNKDPEKLIFDYRSKVKVFKSSKIKGDTLKYEIFENPLFKNLKIRESQWNLKINETILTNLNIETGSINGFFDLSNLKIENFNLNSKSSRIEIKLPNKEGNTFLNLKFKPSTVDIYVPQGFYLEVYFKIYQSITNILEVGFNEKENGIFYLDGGDRGKIFIKIFGNNLNINFHSIE